MKLQVFMVNPALFGAMWKELFSFMADGVFKVGVYNPVWARYVGIL